MKQYLIKYYSPDCNALAGNAPAVLTPLCDDPEYCEDSLPDKCILHKGDTLTNPNAPEDTRLDEILKTIDHKVGDMIDLNKLILLISTNQDVRNAIQNAVIVTPA
jgi:hypothetical protein